MKDVFDDIRKQLALIGQGRAVSTFLLATHRFNTTRYTPCV